MKLGDILIYVGENVRGMKKYDKYVLIVNYEYSVKHELIGIQLYGSDDEDDFYIRDKINFITIKEYRKQKLKKLNQCI